MHNRLTHLLLVVGLTAIAPIAMANPDQKSTDPTARKDRGGPAEKDASDDVHVTVTAGRGRLGVAVVQISPELRAHFGAPDDRGVLVNTVRPDSPAARAGVRVGDLVLEVDGDAAGSAVDMLQAMSDRKKGERVALEVLRGGKRLQLSATLDDDPGSRWQGFGRDFEKAFPRGFERDFDWQPPGLRDDLRRDLDDARRRIEELERKLNGRTRTWTGGVGPAGALKLVV
jgi:hypothetical protein